MNWRLFRTTKYTFYWLV